MNVNASPNSPTFADVDGGDFYRQQHLEEYDINSPESPNNKQRSNTVKTARQVGGAAIAGTVAGLIVSGPIAGVAVGSAAAYAATAKSGFAGDLARQTGETVITVGEKAREIDEKHEVMKRTMMAAKSSMQKVKDLDETHGILRNAKMMVDGAVRAAKTLEEKHHVTEKTVMTAAAVMGKAKDIDKKHGVAEKTMKAAGDVVAKAKDASEQHHIMLEKTKGVALAASENLALGIEFISKSVANKKGPAGDAAISVS